MARRTKKSSKPRLTNNDIYQEVTDRVCATPSSSIAPWRKPWVGGAAGMPISLNTLKAYRGVNIVLLAMTQMALGYCSRYWLTYKQAKAKGGQVRAGEKGTRIVFWNFFKKDAKDENGKPEFDQDGNVKQNTIPFMKWYTVFNTDQIDGLKCVPVEQTNDEVDGAEVFAAGEAIIAGWVGKPSIGFGGTQAFYRPATDTVMVPERDTFKSTAGFYSTTFHELVHSTGHKSRLDRDGISGAINFGSHDYSKEELVAELGSAFIAATAGVPMDIDNNAAYCANWLKVLQNDNKFILSAASKAQKAADMILGVEAPR